ncbi:hypothetical protein [Mucilaginibacter sp.]|uniref:hypothetical protein n=1 Tax=Mucilaginibacter sp. TaxID=1882438 RepID=UPI0025F1C6E2|nr:hypothetical protein [Mucilaginibacter sp.]
MKKETALLGFYAALAAFIAAAGYGVVQILQIIGVVRIFLIANALMIPFIGFAYFYPHFSTWVLLLGAPWLITAPGSILLLANFFWKNLDH